ncbi:MAG: CDP-diacylglycerol--serine O-phosphatidyltransferase [Gammaproteobacteria bacterium]|nr:CDP-diacylglycerol--serine O-phosphatidyltransferase [Gammaproteobacteria bacterium]NNC96746.1 CDP-diacylglycerol--serine O-phosphatidyltransferase [Gammaproteobacteria bacterium]NNM13984.1 CDP-diacylglycerol--serine O-phosphatidyltransferase [Gammaproteobacteria bacterium]
MNKKITRKVKNTVAAHREKRQLNIEAGERGRGVYLLPNLFTTAALFAGFYAVVASMDGNFEKAAFAIFVAMLLDGMDGRVARMTSTETQFGKEYDSLSDMVSFGIAPALVMYQWGIDHLVSLSGFWSKAGWIVAFTYCVCAALRLARFNTNIGKVDKRYFEGLPSPSAAGVVAGLILFDHSFDFDPSYTSFPALIITFFAGALMVSNIKYRSFKDLNLKGKVPFHILLLVPLILGLLFIDPHRTLFISFFAYAISGPVGLVMRRIRGEQTENIIPDDIEDPRVVPANYLEEE